MEAYTTEFYERFTFEPRAKSSGYQWLADNYNLRR